MDGAAWKDTQGTPKCPVTGEHDDATTWRNATARGEDGARCLIVTVNSPQAGPPSFRTNR